MLRRQFSASVMGKRWLALLILLVAVYLGGCVSPSTGLIPFADVKDGYRLLYPNGWVQKSIKNGPDVLFHDIITPSENVSVVIGELKSVKQLQDLGSAQDVGQRVKDRIIAAPNSGREATLLHAETVELEGKSYYLFEYAIKLAQGNTRHDLVSVAAVRDRLYTLDVSAPEERWEKVKTLFYEIVRSFQVE